MKNLSRTKLRSLQAVCLGVLLPLVVAGCEKQEAAREATPQVVTGYSLMAVQQTQLPKLASVVGTVEARQVTPVSARVMATVLTVAVQQGDHVRRGQVLLRLDDSAPRQAVAQAQAGLLAAKQMEASAQSDTALAQSTEKRYAQLFASKSVSPQEFDEVRTRAQSAAARLDMAKAQVQQAQAAVDQARTSLGYTVVAAPYDGIVTERNVDPGVVASPGVPLLVVESVGGYRFSAQVDATQATGIHMGSSASVVIDALGTGAIPVKVTQVVQAADPSSRTEQIKMDLPAMQGVRSGLYGHADFAQGTRTAVLVPVAAIVHRGSLTAVYVTGANHMASLRYVTLGESRANAVEVLSGLSAGEMIVSAPHEADLAGKRIEVR
ncbi:MAG: efflux RND transporter periplasmic adaptor subunit [Acidobacteriaceae bacterium]